MTEFRDVIPPELPRGIALAWGIAAHPQRGPKREMSVERIVDTAVELADTEGLAAVSMAAVAKKLGYTTMSLYRYVSAKDDLLLLMREEVLGLPPAGVHRAHEDAEATQLWRTRLQELYVAQVENFLRHPWVLELPASTLPVTPHSAAWLEAGLEALSTTGLTLHQRLATWYAVVGQAHWHGRQSSHASSEAVGREASQETPQTEVLLGAVIDPELYPWLGQALESGLLETATQPLDFGAHRLFDGLAQYLAAAPAPDDEDRLEPHSPVDTNVVHDKRYKAAQKAVREAQKSLKHAEKALRQAQKTQDQALQDALQRAAKKRT